MRISSLSAWKFHSASAARPASNASFDETDEEDAPFEEEEDEAIDLEDEFEDDEES